MCCWPCVRPSVRLSVCPIIRPQQRCAAGLLLSTVRAGDIDRQRRAPAPSSNGAAARRSAANAGSVMLTAELTRLNTGLFFKSYYRKLDYAWNLHRANFLLLLSE